MMKNKYSTLRWIRLLVAAVCAGNSLAVAAAWAARQAVDKAEPTASTLRLKSTPDLMQSLPAANLPGHGLTYCGPVAVSNSMVWLSRNGFPRLAYAEAESASGQGRLALEIARYTGTTKDNGTTPEMMLAGLQDYVQAKGYAIKSLLYQGWESHSHKFDAGVELPDLDWIKQGLSDRSAVWLMIGWYRRPIGSDTYVPFDQHWVTLVGYGEDRQGKPNPNVLIVHDPAPRSGAQLSHDYVTLEKLKAGRFCQGSQRKHLSAAGWYQMSGELKIKRGADCGILDGAVVLQLK